MKDNMCWASPLEDCEGPLTNEHPYSQAMIPAEGFLVTGFSVTGFSETPRRMTKDDLGSLMLCEKHNNALSPVDQAMCKFKNQLRNVYRNMNISLRGDGGFYKGAPPKNFDGNKIELWFVKVAIGMIYQHFMNTKDSNYPPPIEFLNWLYKKEPIPEPQGLYMDIKDFEKPQGSRARSFSLRMVSDLNHVGRLAGFYCIFEGFNFLLWLSSTPPEDSIWKKNGNSISKFQNIDLMRHPKMINFNVGVKKVDSLHFNWKTV